MAQKKIESYPHTGEKRLNNPPAGLVGAAPPQPPESTRYGYDPHFDPNLDWAGKAERTSFEVPSVSLHVHERIDPRSIIEAVKNKNGKDFVQDSLFSGPEENPPVSKAIEFYKHNKNWSNRIIAGDSLLIMNSLIKNEGYQEKVHMFYIDPPYGIKYGSNYQPFVGKRVVTDGKDEDLTQEPEMIRAFRDTWELGIHSYLTYLRDRLLLAHNMLHESGSCFVQISEENQHLVRSLLDEVFGKENFVSQIAYKTSSGTQKSRAVKRITDYVIWYAKDGKKMKFNRLYRKTDIETDVYNKVEEKNGTRRSMTPEEKEDPTRMLRNGLRPYYTQPVYSSGPGDDKPRRYNGKDWNIPSGRHWSYKPDGFARLCLARRIVEENAGLRSINYFDDFGYTEHTNIWTDTGPELRKSYVVQTSTRVIQRCMLMSTDPGDLVVDITCGSGTTAYVAEQWGRRWITCDTSRIAITLAKQRLLTATYPFYELRHPEGGIDNGMKYHSVAQVQLRSIAYNLKIQEGMSRTEIDGEIKASSKSIELLDEPVANDGIVRVTGPFTYEAVPSESVRPVDEIESATPEADQAIARSGETQRQNEWRTELMKTGVRGKGGQHLWFSRLELMRGTRWIHADGELPPPPPLPEKRKIAHKIVAQL